MVNEMPRINNSRTNRIGNRENTENIVDLDKYRKEKKKISRKRKSSKRVVNEKRVLINNRKAKKASKKRPSRSKDFLFVLFLILLVFVMLSIIVYRYSKISLLKYDMIDINQQISELDNEIKVLNLKIDEVSSSKIMEEKAKDLGMDFRSKENIVYVLVE